MSKSKDNKREIAAVFLGVSVAVILWITVFRRETIVADSLVFQPFLSIWSFWSNIRKQGIRGNVLGNILIFVPLGLLYPMAFGAETTKKLRRTILFGFCLSLLVEITQLLFSRGYFDLDDLFLNTLGDLIGYGLYKVFKGKPKND